jgi:hypothetical protein
VAATDALSDVINNMVTVINSQNGGDPNVVANADTGDSDSGPDRQGSRTERQQHQLSSAHRPGRSSPPTSPATAN